MGRGDKIVASSHFTVHTSSVWSVASMKEGRHLENEYISYFTSWPSRRRTQSGDLLCFPSLHHCSRLNLHAICSQLEPGIVVGLAPPPRRATGDFSLSLDLLLPIEARDDAGQSKWHGNARLGNPQLIPSLRLEICKLVLFRPTMQSHITLTSIYRKHADRLRGVCCSRDCNGF